MVVVVLEDAVNGLDIYGPFIAYSLALEWARKELKGNDWLIKELIPPTSLSEESNEG